MPAPIPQPAPAGMPVVCPRCDQVAGIPLDVPPVGDYNPIFRCSGKKQGCGFLWSPNARPGRRAPSA